MTTISAARLADNLAAETEWRRVQSLHSKPTVGWYKRKWDAELAYLLRQRRERIGRKPSLGAWRCIR